MPATREALTASREYRRAVLRDRELVVAQVARQWRGVAFGDDRATFDRSFAAWLEASTTMLTAAQRRTALRTRRFLGDFLAAELGDDGATVEADVRRYVGRTRDGRPVGNVLALASVSATVALRQRRPPNEALAAGLARATRAVRTEAVDAGRALTSDVLRRDGRFAGWQRQTSAKPCGACLGLAARGPRRTDEGLQIHANCSCTAVPIVGGVRSTVSLVTGAALWERMAPAEQDELLGPERAELLREGEIGFDDLVTEHRHPQWADGVYETPLKRLPT